jgi:hypothetical protein
MLPGMFRPRHRGLPQRLPEVQAGCDLDDDDGGDHPVDGHAPLSTAMIFTRPSETPNPMYIAAMAARPSA